MTPPSLQSQSGRRPKNSISLNNPSRQAKATHLDFKISVHESMALKRSIAIVGHHERGVQAVAVEGDTVKKTEAEGPLAPDRFVEVFGGETEVQFDTRRRPFTG